MPSTFKLSSICTLLWKVALPSTSKLSFKVVTPSTFNRPSRSVYEFVPQANALVQVMSLVKMEPELMSSACKSLNSASSDHKLCKFAFWAPMLFAVKTSKSMSVSSRSMLSMPGSSVNSISLAKAAGPRFQYNTSMMLSSRAIARSTSDFKAASKSLSASANDVEEAM